MRLLFLVFAVMAALVTACPPPFNSVLLPPTVPSKGNNTVDRRWTDYVTDPNSVAKPWPRGQDGFTRIRYCYASPEHRQYLYHLVQAALRLWFDALRPAGQANRHSLSVEEHPASYCYYARDVNNPNAPWQWNQAVPEETLSISVDNSISSAASYPGYSDGSLEHRLGMRTAGRHNLKINMEIVAQFRRQESRAVADLAHELGHVFGLEHEHQRDDRDHYVFFDCSNLQGYPEVAARVRARGEDTIEAVCTSPTLAEKYDFNIIGQYSKTEMSHTINGVLYEWRRRHGAIYDNWSIMHYRSQGAARYFNPADPSTALVPLRRWKNGGPNFQPPQAATPQNSDIIYLNERPSGMDIQRIKEIYHWL